MEKLYQDLFSQSGIQDVFALPLAWLATFASLAITSYVVSLFVQFILGGVIRKVVSRTHTLWDDYLLNKNFFRKLSFVVPSLCAYALLKFFFPENSPVFPYIHKLTLLLLTIFSTAFFDVVLNNLYKAFQEIWENKHAALRSYVQVTKILLFMVSGILIISIVLEKEPWGILSGIGALTAVLLLVFKDSLLGFVASLQLGSNDLVKIGDWIEIPGQGVEGAVIDISLTVVKIRSGDNTIFSVPTYNLVSGAFKNWRNVSEAGARQLKLSLSVDANALKFVDSALQKKLEQKGLWKVTPNLTEVTNIEAFQLFAQNYLETHEWIHHDLAVLAKISDSTGRGIPIEMSFFTQIKTFPEWALFNSRLRCHFLALFPEFGLKLFQEHV